VLHQSDGGGGRGTESDFCHLSARRKCWSVAHVVTSRMGVGVQCHRGRWGLVAGLCSTKVASPEGRNTVSGEHQNTVLGHPGWWATADCV